MDLNFQSFRSICDFNQTSGMSYGTTKDAKKDLQNDIETFKLRKIDQFSDSTCYMNVKWFDERGVNMISCLDKEKHSFSLYDVETVSRANDPTTRKRRDEIYPLFQYHINENTSLLHPTNRLLFSVHRGDSTNRRGILSSPSFERDDNEYQERLFVMSRSSLLVNSNSTKNNSILQEFLLPANEMVKGFLSGFMYREDSISQYKFKEEATQFELEGVILWTQTGIYELRQKYAPLKIFEYIISNKQNVVKDSAQVDQFGQTFEMDILKLYEQYADEKFESGDIDFAFTLYNLSNVNEVKYVQRLSQAKRSEEAFNYLLSVLENSGSISLSKRKQLSNLLFDCFMQKLISSKECDVELCKQFKNFLLANTDINPQVVISQLVQYCCCDEFKSQEQTIINMELVLEIAHKHNLVKYTLQFLVSRGYINILTEEGGIRFLHDNEYAYTTQSVGYGVLLQHCSTNTKLKFLLDYLETMRATRARVFSSSEEEENEAEKDEYFGAMNFGKKPTNTQKESPIKQQLFFEDTFETIQYNSKLFGLILCLLPRVDDLCLLLNVCTKFNPEENSFITKETRQTSSALMKDPSYTRYFHYPYIHLEQHLEIFIVAMLCLVNLKKKLAFNLPDSTNSLNISSNNLYTHTQEKLEQCIKCYNMYRKQFVVSYCLKLHNKSVLALIYEKDEMWIDALCCKLVQLKENFKIVLQEPTMMENLLKQFYTIFDRYLTNKSNELDEETKLKMLEKLFNFYCSLSLPVSKLEDHCLRNIHIIGDTLSLLLLLPSQNNASGSILKKNLKFSHQFYLKITQSYVRNVKRHEKEEEKASKNLLQQIFRNMEKDLYKRNYISITQSEISRLHQQDEKLVVFTCGDHYTRTNFTNNIIPEFKNRTSQLISVMSSDLNKKVFNLATDYILKDYQNLLEERCMHTNQACPICVFNFFLKNEKAKVQKLKPQATRMFHHQQILPNNSNPSNLSEGTLQYISNIEKITSWTL
ncbi:hypothetical protein NAEGRDRAFT_77840 [Naegleria gruberi]|uniref:Uncharacterized protein n=1 Tax=Naegleria gruberi TaxID=5762 RepID=D2UX60_NAEGR|nr:uncharacterized protein NAEGRDRAFT_77840 [Naegleria gruberi]EFC50569.1 hypothetical protein NAEGRDRAFT_77840 [Naegleria gruberi]|eukprot:XP_002683313.1 hypothetical protein NAEGRDRAFT_77840 [Naegleria gruberi strain NEG-M]